MRKLGSLLLAGSMLALTLLTGCGGGSDSQPQGPNSSAKKDSLVIALTSETPTLDPHYHSGSQFFLIDTQIYDNLIVLNDETRQFDLRLAERLDFSDDGTEAVIKIKEGVKFTNGDEVKASDVKFSFDRCLASPILRGRVDVITGCDVIDEYTVKMHFAHPYALAEQILSNCYIVSERAVTEAGDDYGNDPSTVVGSGPYKVVSWDKNQKITLTRNDDYFGDVAKIRDVEFRFLTDETTATMALEKGQIDYLWNFKSEETLKSLQNDETITILQGSQFRQNYLLMNNEKAPFDNPDVRKAIAYAIDRDGATFVALGEIGAPMYTFLAPGTVGNAEDITAPEYNVEKAKEYLAKAGYPNGFSCKLSVFAGTHEKLAPIIQANLGEIGIEVSIETMEFNTLLEKQYALDYDLSMQGWYNGGDADWMPRYYNSTSPNNMFGYRNTKIDELLEQGRREINVEKRMEIYREALEIIRDDMPVVPLATEDSYAACNQNLKNALMPIFMIYPLNHLSWS